MRQKVDPRTLSRADDHEFLDISAPSDDINGERALALGIRPLRVKMFDWGEIQAALDAGAATEDEAKSRATPHYVEVSVVSGALKLTVLQGSTERGSVVLSIDGEPTVQVWDEFSDSDEPEVCTVFATEPSLHPVPCSRAILRLL